MRARPGLSSTKDASPLQGTLKVDFQGEAESAAVRKGWPPRGLRPITRAAVQEWARRDPVVHASRVISWAERRAGSVRKLHLTEEYPEAYFSPPG